MEVKYDAITLDTSIFRKSGYKFHGGLLAQLKQFRDGPAEFVLSEIVAREVEKHLCGNTSKVKDAFLKAVKQSVEVGLIQQEHTEHPDSIVGLAKSADSNDLAKSRFDKFIEECNAEIVPIIDIDIQTLVDMYFEPSAPFDATGKKKHEFPDAIALLSIEKWAKANNKNILAVSEDGGWKKYGEISNYIDVDDDLSSALSKFQRDAENALAHVIKLVSSMDDGELKGSFDKIEKLIEMEVSFIDFIINVSSNYSVERGHIETYVNGVSFSKSDGLYDVTLVLSGRNKIVALVGLRVEVTVITELFFFITDPIDQDRYLSDNTDVCGKTSLNASVSITFEGDFTQDQQHDVEVTEVEILDIDKRINFGHVFPEMGNPNDEFYDDFLDD